VKNIYLHVIVNCVFLGSVIGRGREHWNVDFGPRTRDVGPWTVNRGPWTVN